MERYQKLFEKIATFERLAINPRSNDAARWDLMIRGLHELVNQLDPMYQLQDHKERQYHLRQLYELTKAAIEENI